MPLSKKKRTSMELADRVRKVNARSLNGKGYFMDHGHEMTAQKYIETGDQTLLDSLPDYPKQREMEKKLLEEQKGNN